MMKIVRGDIEESINWQGGKKERSYYENFDKIDWNKGKRNPTPVKMVKRARARDSYANLMLEVKENVAEARKPVHLKKNLQ